MERNAGKHLRGIYGNVDGEGRKGMVLDFTHVGCEQQLVIMHAFQVMV